MVSPFEVIAVKLGELGVYSFFLPWVMTAALFWGLLKKSGVFESPSTNGVFSLVISFFVWGYLTSSGAVDIAIPLSTFIMQSSVFILLFLFAIIGGSMFYPDLSKVLVEQMKRRTMIYMFLGIFSLVFFTSGLYRIILGPSTTTTGPRGDINMIVAIIATFIIFILIIYGIQRGGVGG